MVTYSRLALQYVRTHNKKLQIMIRNKRRNNTYYIIGLFNCAIALATVDTKAILLHKKYIPNFNNMEEEEAGIGHCFPNSSYSEMV